MRCEPFHSSHQVQDRWKHFHHFDHLECREKQVQQAKERNWILILYTESSSCVHSLISWVLRQKSSTFRSNPRFKLWSICRQQLPLRLKFPIWSISPLSIFPLFYHSSCSPPHGGELLKIHDSRNCEKLYFLCTNQQNIIIVKCHYNQLVAKFRSFTEQKIPCGEVHSCTHHKAASQLDFFAQS